MLFSKRRIGRFASSKSVKGKQSKRERYNDCRRFNRRNYIDEDRAVLHNERYTILASPRVELAAGPGSITNLTMGRMSSEDAVRTVATRVTPSSPRCSLVMRARGHLLGGDVSEAIRHNEPILGAALTLHHFRREVKECKYSRDHLSQKWSRIACRCCQRESELIAFSASDRSGMASSGAPMSRCPGVSAERSSGSSDNASNGREFRQAST